jgi:hypothetical protein
MAALIPHYDPEDITTPSERVVAEALCAQLPKNVRVFHSYPWLRQERDLEKPGKREVIREGEADFVIVDPRYGFMVIEVKGGHMFYEPSTQRWDRRGATHPVKDPFGQAADNLRVMERILQERSFPGGPNQMPFVRARAVVFPDCDYQGTLPPGATTANLFGAKDLAVIGRKVEQLSQSYPFKASPQGIGQAILDKILMALSSTFRLTPALWREVEDQEKQIHRLTDEQAQILDFLGDRERAMIRGVAGSGKTMLAMIRARRFADEDSKVLFVCFNSLLADWLERELPEEYRNLITIRNYHKLCAEWVKRAGIPWPNAGSDAEFWKSKAPRLFEQALDRLPDDRFDAVVVDEGQDFETDWWDGLEMVNRNMTDGALFVFLDPAQRIFSESQAYLPVLGEPFTLPVNCRNTEAIANKCGQVLGENIRTRPGAPKGREPVRIVAETSAAQASAVEKQVKEWLNAGLKPSQIAVVTARSVENGCLHRKDRLAGALLTDDLARWRKGEGVLISTVGKFKGLEADAIVLTDVPEYSPYFRKEHLYVACSRAKHLLTVITLTPDQAD